MGTIKRIEDLEHNQQIQSLTNRKQAHDLKLLESKVKSLKECVEILKIHNDHICEKPGCWSHKTSLWYCSRHTS